jgi:hypothetical protein
MTAITATTHGTARMSPTEALGGHSVVRVAVKSFTQDFRHFFSRDPEKFSTD